MARLENVRLFDHVVRDASGNLFFPPFFGLTVSHIAGG
jgi:hypothetical protein